MKYEMIQMPENSILKALFLGWIFFLHGTFRCRVFWVNEHNKKGRVFRRKCAYCGIKNHRVNGEWRFGH